MSRKDYLTVQELQQKENLYFQGLDENGLAYLKELYSDASYDTAVYVRALAKEQSMSLQALDSANFGSLRHFYKYDLYITPNGFKRGTERTEMRITDIYAIALDIDYRKDGSWGNETASAIDFFFDIFMPSLDGKIPQPTYIEYGHQMRLIYVLDEHIHLTQKNRRKLLKTLKIIIKRLCDIINAEDKSYYAEPQKINSFFRVPGSINNKECYDENGSSFKWQVGIKKLGDKIAWQDFFEYLPELPEWYENWSGKKDLTISRKGNISQIHNAYQLEKDRQAFFKSLRERPGIKKYNLVWHYLNSLFYTDTPTLEDIEEFCKGFPTPLTEKEMRYIRSRVRANIKNQKYYRYTNNKIADNLGIERIEIMTKREIEKREKIAKGETREQKKEQTYSKIEKLYLNGADKKSIASALGMSEKQVAKYITEVRKANNVKTINR